MIVDNFVYLWIDFEVRILSPVCADVSPAYPQFLGSCAQGGKFRGITFSVTKLTELQVCNYTAVNKVVDSFVSWAFIGSCPQNPCTTPKLQKDPSEDGSSRAAELNFVI
ncbi:hypothetical protein CEY17_00010 [Corynebacterium glutamicum ATCC 14067]|nr:hypothetical protein CEY17_00010 [Corynebacterium glutamicum ATCC 14067]